MIYICIVSSCIRPLKGDSWASRLFFFQLVCISSAEAAEHRMVELVRSILLRPDASSF